MSPHQNEKVFFYCCPTDSAEDANYQHSVVQLAEGLKQLQVNFYANINYWQLSPDEPNYLLQYSPQVTHHDCTIVVFDQHWYRKNGIPQDLFSPDRQYITVFLDSEDGAVTASYFPEFKQFDIILKAHCSSKIQQPDNCYPWAFGLTERILKETEAPLVFDQRKQSLLVNFRHHPILGSHSIRRYIDKAFIPRIADVLSIDRSRDPQNEAPSDPYHYLQWVQSGRRHYPSYFKRLQESVACTAFGGFFFPPFIENSYALPNRILKKLWIKSQLKSNRVFQWDSWRFWESMAAGCATFHLDFEKYGFLLPAMPQNWVHYVGVDLDNIRATVDRLAEEPEILEQVACAGRAWAISNYGSESAARRLIEIVQRVRQDTLLKNTKTAPLSGEFLYSL